MSLPLVRLSEVNMGGGSIRTEEAKCLICGAIGILTVRSSYAGGSSSFACPFWGYGWHNDVVRASEKARDTQRLLNEKHRLSRNQAYPKTYREEAEREAAELETQLAELHRLEDEARRHAVEQREKEEQEAERRQAEEKRTEKKKARAKLVRQRKTLRAELTSKTREELVEIILRNKGLLR